jgi:hypothetical protein
MLYIHPAPSVRALIAGPGITDPIAIGFAAFQGFFGLSVFTSLMMPIKYSGWPSPPDE